MKWVPQVPRIWERETTDPKPTEADHDQSWCKRAGSGKYRLEDRVAAKLNRKPRPRPNSAGRRPSNSINCKKLTASRTECHANSQLGSFSETQRAGRSGVFQGASNCALKISTRAVKLLI